MELRTDDFDYHLPPGLIAQEPLPQRGMSRLLVLYRGSGRIVHDRFSNLPAYLRRGDVLVANRSKVLPARVWANKKTGGAVELLLLQPAGEARWLTLARPSRKLRPGASLKVRGEALEAILEEHRAEGQWVVRFVGDGDVASRLRRAGTIPLPPYIHNEHIALDRYQTVYADREGSVAAPTAGLHFSPSILRELSKQGVGIEHITLHIGLGTFRPVTVDRVEQHRMHPEWGEVPAETAAAIEKARRAGGRVVAVGTTSTRLLESACEDGELRAFTGMTDRFIYPGYTFRAVDALLTNFHLPRSTLLMLVSAFAGRDTVLAAYQEAIREGYRFYSFGDAMLIL